jgi:type I restriction enzyme S subunit
MSHYKHYPTHKKSGVPWIEPIPEHWDVKPICRVASCNDDVMSESTPADEMLRYVDISSVNQADGIKHAVKVRFADAPSRARRKAIIGDVLVSTVRTYLKAVAAVTTDYADCIFSTGFAVLRARGSHFDSAFLKWMILNDLFVQAIEAHSEGLSYPAINATELVKLKVVVPPKTERCTIAAVLDRETTRVDALIAQKTRFVELLKEKRQAFIAHAVTKGINPDAKTHDSRVEWIGNVPEHWEIRRMATLFREVSRPGDSTLPILSISIHDGITDDELEQEERERRVSHIEDRTKYKRVAPNDLAYNMMRAWQGAFGAVTVEGLVSPAYVVAEPTDLFRTCYIELLLRTTMAIEEMRRFSRGIADFRMRLYWDYFRDLKVCLPPLKEQDEILARISLEISRIDLLAEKIQRSIDLLKERRSSFITAAVTGQIDLRGSA